MCLVYVAEEWARPILKQVNMLNHARACLVRMLDSTPPSALSPGYCVILRYAHTTPQAIQYMGPADIL